jgi:hypothetical protein
MNRLTATLSIVAAFTAGCGMTYLMQPARAAAENVTAQVIHTGELEGDALSPAAANGMRNKMFVSVDGATLSQYRTATRPSICIPMPTRSNTSLKAPGQSGSATRK